MRRCSTDRLTRVASGMPGPPSQALIDFRSLLREDEDLREPLEQIVDREEFVAAAVRGAAVRGLNLDPNELNRFLADQARGWIERRLP